MGIPILSEIWDGVRWIIDFFINKTPKVVQLLFFLLFLLAFGFILTWMFHLSGIHCNNAGNVVKTDIWDIGSNINILRLQNSPTFTEQNLTIDDVNPDKGIFTGESLFQQCLEILKNESGEWQLCDDINNESCYFFYENQDCYPCDTIKIGWINDPDAFFNWYYVGEVCSGDVIGTSTPSKYSCDTECYIPDHYRWDYEDGIFICEDLDYCGAIPTKIPKSELDKALDIADAELFYTSTITGNSEDMIRFQCDKQKRPIVTFFGLEIFNYKYWLLIFVVALLFIFLHKIKN